MSNPPNTNNPLALCIPITNYQRPKTHLVKNFTVNGKLNPAFLSQLYGRRNAKP